MMQSITASKTIEKLRIVFSTHELPRKIVTDSGPTFVSEEFKTFMKGNGIKHVTTTPYHPSSNGQAERAVQIVIKQALRSEEGNNVQEKLSKCLFAYRITPHSTIGLPPAQLLMGRRPRSPLDMLFPDVGKTVEKAQEKQKKYHDNSKKLRIFSVGDKVLAKNFRSSRPKWLVGEVVKVSGPLSYVIKLTNGRRHVDYVKKRDYVSESVDPAPDSRIESEMYGSDFNSSPQTTEPVVDSGVATPGPGGPGPSGIRFKFEF